MSGISDRKFDARQDSSPVESLPHTNEERTAGSHCITGVAEDMAERLAHLIYSAEKSVRGYELPLH